MAAPTPGTTLKAGTSLQNPSATGILWADGIVTGQGCNYIIAGGSSNTLQALLTSIVPGVMVTVAEGLEVTVKTNVSLQSGANTFNLNSHGTDSIKNSGGNNIKTSIAAGAILKMVFDGTNWRLLNSTY